MYFELDTPLSIAYKSTALFHISNISNKMALRVINLDSTISSVTSDIILHN